MSQNQCQIKFFKIEIKIFLSIILIFFSSCDSSRNRIDNIGKNLADVQLDRFDKKFFLSEIDSLPNLISDYPFLFSDMYSLNHWVAIKTDSTRLNIFKKTQEVFSNVKPIENEIERIFSKTKAYFPDFSKPKLITLNNGIDYKYKMIDSDSIVLISLDCYLGDYSLYNNIPSHISKLMSPEFITVELSELISSRYLRIPSDRKFISKIIYHGKLLYLMSKISDLEPHELLGYEKNKHEWMVNNENDVWKYFIENELLFSTQSSLDYRFLANAPFSKFGLSIDFESPPMIGRWMGYRIVQSYAIRNKENLMKILSYDNYKLYLESNYKPKR